MFRLTTGVVEKLRAGVVVRESPRNAAVREFAALSAARAGLDIFPVVDLSAQFGEWM